MHLSDWLSGRSPSCRLVFLTIVLSDWVALWNTLSLSDIREIAAQLGPVSWWGRMCANALMGRIAAALEPEVLDE